MANARRRAAVLGDSRRGGRGGVRAGAAAALVLGRVRAEPHPARGRVRCLPRARPALARLQRRTHAARLCDPCPPRAFHIFFTINIISGYLSFSLVYI